MTKLAILPVLALFAFASEAQQPRRPRAPQIVSPEVHPDRTVTFRLIAPKASEVLVSGEIAAGAPKPMTRNEQGLWSITLGPLDPELYGYSFVIDGVSAPDPNNPYIRPGVRTTSSQVEVPADQPRYYDFRPVPHGNVDIVWYESKSLSLPRSVYIYTPPGYEKGKRRYPVLYLLHGVGDTENGWMNNGRANFILDNLIADGKARPMLVVMPFGHVQPSVGSGLNAPAPSAADRSRFTNDLLQDIIPLVESRYRVLTGPDQRAIAGLSMGGNQALTIGLTHLDKFHWIGGFSSALFVGGSGTDPAKTFADLVADPAASNKNIRLLWMGCGKQDRLFEANQKFADFLQQHGIHHTFISTEGVHQWKVWRYCLNELAPLLFSGKPA